MTRRSVLTDSTVRSKNKAPGYYLDGAGLYLQVSKSGSRSWIFRYTLHGKTREMGLGSLDTFGLAQARERAQRARQLLADGIDPIDQRNGERKAAFAHRAAERARLKTFESCAREYHAASADEWKNAKHAAQWINTLTQYVFPKFGRLPVDEVGKAEIVAVLTPLWKSKAETASRLFQRIRTVINFAAARDYTTGKDAEFWEQVKMALGPNERARKVEHHISCPYPLVGAVLKEVAISPSSPIVRLALEFTVLTAARSGETRGALWTEIDWDTRCWNIPEERMKAGRRHSVPLSARAVQVLQEAKKLHDAGIVASELGLIFPNTKGLPLSDMVFTQLLRRLQLEYTMHGFRASFRTWGSEQTRYEHEMLEFALAHTVGDQTVRAYMRTDMLEKRRQLMDDWAAFIAANSSGDPPRIAEKTGKSGAAKRETAPENGQSAPESGRKAVRQKQN
ncbi:Prophage integrase IntA [Xylophilus ampelinus]|uniref:Integrase n=1 Tax=Variovorax paradoxus TaxID=34073 RepID=A0A2W5QI20_VARPD|nr:MAG: integrase [Variovorax paradoxus]VTY30242.1 Prophage integrase IntA [Xylophilus ampelinus]